MKTLESVAKRIKLELGISDVEAMRIAEKMNNLAKDVPWARSIEEQNRKKPKR